MVPSLKLHTYTSYIKFYEQCMTNPKVTILKVKLISNFQINKDDLII